MLEAFGQALKGAEEALDPYRRMTAAEALTLSGALTLSLINICPLSSALRRIRVVCLP